MTEEAKKVKVEPVPVNIVIEEVIKKIEELEERGSVPIEEYLSVLEKVKALQERLKEEKLISFNIEGLKERLSKVETIWHTVEPEEVEKILSLKDYDERLEEGVNLLFEVARDPIGMALLSNFEQITLQQLKELHNELKRYVKKDEIEEQLSKVEKSLSSVREIAEELKKEKDKVVSEIKEAGEQVKKEVLSEVREEIDVVGEKLQELEHRISELESDTSETNDRVTGLIETLNRKLEETKKELYTGITQNPEFKIEVKNLIEEVLAEKGTSGIDVEAIKREIKEELMAEILARIERENPSAYGVVEKEAEETEQHGEAEETGWEEEEAVEEENEKDKKVKAEKSKGSDKTFYINLGILAIDVILIIEILSSLL